MPAKPKRIQDRNFFCVSYLTEEQINEVLQRKQSQVKQFAYILHDKDVESDGTPKAPHYHIIVALYNSVNLSTFKNWWKGHFDEKGMEVNTLVQLAGSVPVCWAYLTHKDDPDKYQYNPVHIVASDHSYFEDDTKCEADRVWEFVEMILDGTPLREVAKLGGRDFIYHYSAIRAMVDDIRREEQEAKDREHYRMVREVRTAFENGEDVVL